MLPQGRLRFSRGISPDPRGNGQFTTRLLQHRQGGMTYLVERASCDQHFPGHAAQCSRSTRRCKPVRRSGPETQMGPVPKRISWIESCPAPDINKAKQGLGLGDHVWSLEEIVALLDSNHD